MNEQNTTTWLYDRKTGLVISEEMDRILHPEKYEEEPTK